MRFSLPVFWLISATMLLAQLAPQPPQAAYAGQNVSAVSLIANPHRDLTSLYALVEQTGKYAVL